MRRRTENEIYSMADIKETIANAVVKAKTEEHINELDQKQSKVMGNLEDIYANRLKEKADALEALEKQLDERMAQFKDFADKTAIGGKAKLAFDGIKSQRQRDEEVFAERVKKIRSSIGR